jgi:hypothetical protein
MNTTGHITAEFDLSLLNERLGNFMGALIGTGQGGDIHRFLAVEAAQLSADISRAVGPASVEKAKAGVDRSLKFVFRSTRKDGETPISSNLTEEQSSSSVSDFKWIYAFKKNGGGVLGINNEDDLRGTNDAATLETVLRAGLKHKRGHAYEELGKRGKMHIMRLNRVLIQKAAWVRLQKTILARAGKMRASFAYTTFALNKQFGLSVSERMPAFVKRHVQAGDKVGGRAIFNLAALASPTNPSITFGSSAKGVVSNPYVAAKIGGVIAGRSHKIAKKMKQVIAGYSYNWNTGAVFKSQVDSGGIS